MYYIKKDAGGNIVAKGKSEAVVVDMTEVDEATYDAAVIAPPPPRSPVYTGRDVLDGMSPDQAKSINTEDPRNLARIAAAVNASSVKSCIARAEKVAGLAPGTLLKQATPTG